MLKEEPHATPFTVCEADALEREAVEIVAKELALAFDANNVEEEK